MGELEFKREKRCEEEEEPRIREGMASESMAKKDHNKSGYLHRFWLYETRSKFYLIGRNKSKTLWKVLKINKTEHCELSITEDASSYSGSECQDFLNRINEGNKSTGGLRFVTNCYGIVGFVKFFGPYYMLLITERKKIGSICGHTVYAIAKSEIFTVGNSSLSLDVAHCRNESRYKKLFCSVDLTKDFFFSYSYPIMNSLQKNFCDRQKRESLNGSMFVWNEFLVRGIRDHLKNNFWTVSLVYGFFKQGKLSISGKEFYLTLIARRSRHYAGTRYLRRGINEKGKVANDVETEQIISEEKCDCGIPIQISSIVQNRGSIPLFWSQETSRLNLKPDIILHKKDENYEATRRHFENLSKRYGNPIIILNLIKTNEKRPRESILREEFTQAINTINEDLSVENQLKYLHWDLHSHFRRKTTNVLGFLERVSACALKSTGFFYCQVNSSLGMDDDVAQSKCQAFDDFHSPNIGRSSKFPKLQSGVLRTNCIDCLDRTNVAQYMHGLAAFGRQLHKLHLIDEPRVDLDTPLADYLMKFYESMGDTLALQYGGSAAHNKIFCQRRGQWKVAIQSQEFFRTLQRYYSNAYVDSWKQDAINVFLGHLRPLNGKSCLWDMDSDLQLNLDRCHHAFADGNLRSIFERSLSDGNFQCDNCAEESSVDLRNGEKEPLMESALTVGISKSSFTRLSASVPVIPCEADTSDSRCTPSEVCRRENRNEEDDSLSELRVDLSTSSNFMDLDWILPSESDNSSLGGDSPRESMGTLLENGSDLPVSVNASWVSLSLSPSHSPTLSSSHTLSGSPSASLSLSPVSVFLVFLNHLHLIRNFVQFEKLEQELTDSGQNLGILQEFPQSFVHWVEQGGVIFL